VLLPLHHTLTWKDTFGQKLPPQVRYASRLHKLLQDQHCRHAIQLDPALVLTSFFTQQAVASADVSLSSHR